MGMVGTGWTGDRIGIYRSRYTDHWIGGKICHVEMEREEMAEAP